LALDGKVGSVPDWYMLIRAARYLNVAPWDLMEQPSIWMYWALQAESAEDEAQGIKAKHNRK